MEQILRNVNIWDLHIHTPVGTPTKKNYENDSTKKFIDTIIDIYNKSINKISVPNCHILPIWKLSSNRQKDIG